MRVAQPVAAWLIQRPQNTVLGLLASLVLPPTPFLGAAVMTFLLLHEARLQKLAAFAAIAVAFMAALNTAFGASPMGVLRLAALTWIPAAAFGLFMRRCKSLTLTVQFSVLVLLVLVLGAFVSLGDATEVTRALVAQVAEIFREAGYTQQAEILLAREEVAGWQIMSLIVLMLWSSFTLALAVGNAMFGSVHAGGMHFGKFERLDLGRVLAGIAAVAGLVALGIDALWFKAFASIALLMFWIQGLAVLHWLHHNRSMPRAILIGIYVLLPFLNMLLVVALAAVGYLDAWFSFRRKLATPAA